MQPNNLWAPWRMQYIRQLDPAANPAQGDAGRACFLCDAAHANIQSDDAAERLMLINDGRGMVLLNRYPYTNGHLLVAPARHVAALSDLTHDERAGLMELTALSEQLITVAMHSQGINVGINLGRCAGAGLPGHLHVHLVPRWHGDTNFITVVGQVRVLPQALEDSFQYLRDALSKLERP